MTPLDEEQRGSISRGYCPDCSHAGFRLGPLGADAINIACMNVNCGERFNVATFSGVVLMAHRIDKSSDWPTSVNEIHVVQAIVSLLPNDKNGGLLMLDQARAMVMRFKRS